MSENWIDQGKAPSLDATLAAIDQGSISAVNIYMGGRFAYLGGPPANGWTPQFVQAIAAARPQVAFFGSWVSLSPGEGGYALGHQDGLDASNAARAYPVRLLSYDVEPSTFDANPTGAADAMHGFTDAVHSQGLFSMPYSVERGLVAGLAGADALWIANPGGDDPAHARLPLTDDIFVGRRSVQCCQLVAAGVSWGLSHSQFSIGGPEVLDPNDPIVQRLLAAVEGSGHFNSVGDEVYSLFQDTVATVNAAGHGTVGQVLLSILAKVNSIPAVSALTPDQAKALADTAAAVARLETALKQA